MADFGDLPAEARTTAPSRRLLRFLTCGSVDDGKSTLIGRLLHDCGGVADDVAARLEQDSRRFGTVADGMDYALLLDGLEAERQQGITIDVAHRYFSTPVRAFIVADTPGHEQYTRNMATGASTAELAVILVDAEKGLRPQTRRHSCIVSLLGVKHVVLAVNKMDLVGWSQAAFEAIEAAYRSFAEALGFTEIVAIPVAARSGENLSRRGEHSPWYEGPTLIEHLERVDVEADLLEQPFRFPVQWVNRSDESFRGYAGTVASGSIRPGDSVSVSSSGATAKVARIVSFEGDRAEATAGDAVTLTLTEEVDVGRGDLLSPPRERPIMSSALAADLLWLGHEPLQLQRPYLLRIGRRQVAARVSLVEHELDVVTLEPGEAHTLALNGIGRCRITTAEPIAFDLYKQNRTTGGFILIDRQTSQTVAAGMIAASLDPAGNLHRQAHSVMRAEREAVQGHKGLVVWLTGLSGSGKSTVANLVERALNDRGLRTALLDGDNLRLGLNRDLGFDDAARAENIRRAAEVAQLFLETGAVVLCTFVSPLQAHRDLVRERVGAEDFLEVFVDASAAACAARDPKGLYAKAEAGGVANLPGLNAPYERPTAPDLLLETTRASAQDCAAALLQAIERRALGAAQTA